MELGSRDQQQAICFASRLPIVPLRHPFACGGFAGQRLIDRLKAGASSAATGPPSCNTQAICTPSSLNKGVSGAQTARGEQESRLADLCGSCSVIDQSAGAHRHKDRAQRQGKKTDQSLQAPESVGASLRSQIPSEQDLGSL